MNTENIATGTEVSFDTGFDTALLIEGQDLVPECVAGTGIVRNSFGQVGVTSIVRYEIQTRFGSYMVDQGHINN